MCMPRHKGERWRHCSYIRCALARVLVVTRSFWSIYTSRQNENCGLSEKKYVYFRKFLWRLYGARINIFLFLIIYNYLFVINYYSIYVTNDRNDYLILIYFKIESEDISEIYLKKIIRSLDSFRDLIHLEYICIIVHIMFFFLFC